MKITSAQTARLEFLARVTDKESEHLLDTDGLALALALRWQGGLVLDFGRRFDQCRENIDDYTARLTRGQRLYGLGINELAVLDDCHRTQLPSPDPIVF